MYKPLEPHKGGSRYHTWPSVSPRPDNDVNSLPPNDMSLPPPSRSFNLIIEQPLFDTLKGWQPFKANTHSSHVVWIRTFLQQHHDWRPRTPTHTWDRMTSTPLCRHTNVKILYMHYFTEIKMVQLIKVMPDVWVTSDNARKGKWVEIKAAKGFLEKIMRWIVFIYWRQTKCSKQHEQKNKSIDIGLDYPTHRVELLDRKWSRLMSSCSVRVMPCVTQLHVCVVAEDSK